MTLYAVPGELRDEPGGDTAAAARLPDDVRSVVGVLPHVVIPWLCPEHGHLVAESYVTDHSRRPLLTVLEATRNPTRQPAFEDGDVPYWGPSRREMRGHTARRDRARLARASMDRALKMRTPGWTPPHDYEAIRDETFDTLCRRCPVRLRIRLATVIGESLS